MPGRKIALRAWLFIGALLLFSILVHIGFVGKISYFSGYINWTEIQEFLSRSNEGFVLAAIVGIYLELIKPNTFSDYFRTDLGRLDEFLAATDTRSGIEFFLKREYAAQAGLDTLTETIISDRPKLMDVRIRVSLHRRSGAPDESSRGVKRYQISYTANIVHFVLATARTPEIADVISNAGPEIIEVCSCSPGHGKSFATLSKELIASHPVQFNGRPVALTLYAGELSENLADQNVRRGEDYEIFAAKISEPENGSPRRFTVTTEREVDLDRAGHMHWAADRPLYLQEIDIDVSGISDSRSVELNLIPFLGTLDKRLEIKNGHSRIHIDKWLVRGQGVCIWWIPMQSTRTPNQHE